MYQKTCFLINISTFLNGSFFCLQFPWKQFYADFPSIRHQRETPTQTAFTVPLEHSARALETSTEVPPIDVVSVKMIPVFAKLNHILTLFMILPQFARDPRYDEKFIATACVICRGANTVESPVCENKIVLKHFIYMSETMISFYKTPIPAPSTEHLDTTLDTLCNEVKDKVEDLSDSVDSALARKYYEDGVYKVPKTKAAALQKAVKKARAIGYRKTPNPPEKRDIGNRDQNKEVVDEQGRRSWNTVGEELETVNKIVFRTSRNINSYQPRGKFLPEEEDEEMTEVIPDDEAERQQEQAEEAERQRVREAEERKKWLGELEDKHRTEKTSIITSIKKNQKEMVDGISRTLLQKHQELVNCGVLSGVSGNLLSELMSAKVTGFFEEQTEGADKQFNNSIEDGKRKFEALVSSLKDEFLLKFPDEEPPRFLTLMTDVS